MPAYTTIDSFLTMTISLILLQTTKLPIFSSINIYYLYIIFLLSQLINLCILYYIKKTINNVIDHRIVLIQPEVSFFSTGNTSTTNINENNMESITYHDYDKKELTKVVQSTVFNLILSSIMGLYFKSTHPLITGILSVPKCIFLNPLYIQYILKKEMKRPFSENRIFEGKNIETDNISNNNNNSVSVGGVINNINNNSVINGNNNISNNNSNVTNRNVTNSNNNEGAENIVSRLTSVDVISNNDVTDNSGDSVNNITNSNTSNSNNNPQGRPKFERRRKDE
ncbi:hypothetical protein CDIK_3912 [Cucumispora dikerogammari]|nr:hypothetical protein CDIK_3912 [Cucumispora dikerogammari]